MKIQIGLIAEDFGMDICSRCDLECKPAYRICYQLKEKGHMGNEIIDEEFSVCRFCISKLIKNWRNYCDDISNINEVGFLPKKSEWKEVNSEIEEENKENF